MRTNIITTDRPDSSQLVDLHVYIIPKNVWKDRQNLVENEAMEQAISAGFVRVSQNLTIQELRQYILNICGQDDDFPKEFIYLRSVGRCLARVKPQQETDLRVKNYRPPITFAPEIYLLEGNYDDISSATPNSKSFLFRESPLQQGLITPPQLPSNHRQSWIKPLTEFNQPGMLTNYPSLMHTGQRQNSINFTGIGNTSFSNLSTASSTLSARDLAKLREEQERLRLRQIELARQRREIELEQQRRAKELLEKQKNTSKMQQEREEAAATCIQAAYRGYRGRRKLQDEQQRHIEDDDNDDDQHDLERDDAAARVIQRTYRQYRQRQQHDDD